MTNQQKITTLYPKRSSAIWLFFGCAVFVAGGIWMGITESRIGFLIAAFFALGLPIAVVKFLPGSTYLQIEDSGFTFCNLYRRSTIPWSAVDGFFVVTLRQHGMKVRQMTGFNFVESYEKARLGRRIASLIGKCEGALPDTYGLKAEELARLLNEHLAKAKRIRSEKGLWHDQ